MVERHSTHTTGRRYHRSYLPQPTQGPRRYCFRIM